MLIVFLRAFHILCGVFTGFLVGGLLNYEVLKIDGDHPLYRSVVILMSTIAALINAWVASSNDALILLGVETLFIFLVMTFYTPPPATKDQK